MEAVLGQRREQVALVTEHLLTYGGAGRRDIVRLLGPAPTSAWSPVRTFTGESPAPSTAPGWRGEAGRAQTTRVTRFTYGAYRQWSPPGVLWALSGVQSECLRLR
jgi:hypothetical protein